VPDPGAESPVPSIQSSACAPCPLEPIYNLVVADNTAFPHIFKSLAHERILVGVQLNVISDGLIDEITAGAVLRYGKLIERINLFGVGTEANRFFCVAHNAGTIPCLIM